MASHTRSTRSPSSRSGATRAARTAAWAAVRDRDADAMLGVAGDPASDAEALAIITPPWNELAGFPVAVALAVLAHPECPEGLAARLTGHPDPTVRLAVVHYPRQVTSMAIDRLLTDPDPDVRTAARATFTGGAT